MVQSAALLMRERGVEATSFSEVLAHSGAPRGSIYHHFPEGKGQLIEEATRYAGDFIAAGLASSLDEQDPVSALREFCSSWREVLRGSDFAAGCPVVAATLEGELAPSAHETAAASFARWEDLLADAIEQHGQTVERARSLATLVIAAVEGAVVLARAQRSVAPFERVAGELEGVLVAAMTGS
jgi:TetR/AcrR family transcriptional regulator, lmrAB and yxaGH operons repressor